MATFRETGKVLMGKPIIVVGSINLDLVATAERIPLPGETITGRQFQTFFGGKGANQAVAIARLGHPVCMVGKVGADSFGADLVKGLSASGVGTGAVQTASGSSGVALIATSVRGENSIIVVSGANGELLPDDIDRCRDLIYSAGMVLAQLEIPISTVEHLAEIARAAGVPLMLDPAPARELSPQVLDNFEWITPNESETRLLLGFDNAELDPASCQQAAEKLLALGVRNVLLKLGERGSFLAEANGCRASIPAYRVEAVDTTGAGDAFNGAFAVSLMRGNSPRNAARFASAVAAISVTRKGAQASMPDAAEVGRFLRAEATASS
jgi:ribokinase